MSMWRHIAGAVAALIAATPAAAQTDSVMAPEPPLTVFLTEQSYWAPFILDPHSERPGITREVMRAVFDSAGLTIERRIVSRARAARALETGEADFEVGATAWDKGRDVQYVATEPILETVDRLILAESTHLVFDGCASLAGVRLWGVKGYSYPCAETADLRRMANERALIHRVVQGDIAIAIVEERVARHWGRKLGVEPRIGPVMARAAIVIKLQLPRAHLVERLNASIAALRNSGAIAVIKARYLRDATLIPDQGPS